MIRSGRNMLHKGKRAGLIMQGSEEGLFPYYDHRKTTESLRLEVGVEIKSSLKKNDSDFSVEALLEEGKCRWEGN